MKHVEYSQLVTIVLVTREPLKTAVRLPLAALLCAGHAQQFGGESPLPNLMEVKG